ncbi:hypothetical protein FACS1894188_09340 [Clostridia bacterium]|nr:hypothetical protein FACS1894188_09340 [Clostridia bacterium]
MTITMLYFDEICRLIEKYGFGWADVHAIEDTDEMVEYAYISYDGTEQPYKVSLRRAIYTLTMCSVFDENGEREKIFIEAFRLVCEEARNKRLGIAPLATEVA